MICFPNAKINLGLNIVSRRSNGYHNIETVFYPVDLRDALEVLPSDGSEGESGSISGDYRLILYGDPVEGNKNDNLVIRAINLIKSERELPKIDIHLIKRIPSGAGLGGGSADAAFMLKLLNDKLELGYRIDELKAFAAKIGADCPFFLHNKPAFATGIGDVIEPVDVDLSDYNLLIVKPDVLISTKTAYSMITPRQPEVSVKDIVKKPVEEWNNLMKNDFETSLFKKYPQICELKEKLLEMGAVYSSMSGSGSAVYAIFDSKPVTEGVFGDNFVWKSWE